MIDSGMIKVFLAVFVAVLVMGYLRANQNPTFGKLIG